MARIRRIRVSHGELTVQMDSFPARWHKLQREYGKICHLISFKVGRNPDGQLFMKPVYKKIADCSTTVLAPDLPSQFLEVRWLVQSC